MSATDAAPDRAALIARLGRRSWLGMALGVAASGLLLGTLAWVICGWIGVPRAWIPFIGVAMAIFAALEVGVQRRSRARITPVLALLADCVEALPAPESGLHRGLPWVGGACRGRRFTAHVEWHGAERLRLAITVDAELDTTLRLVPAVADDRPDQWLSRLRIKGRHRDVSGLPPSLIGLSPEPPAAEALWAADAALAEAAEALVTGMLPRAAVLDLQPDGVGWDGPLDGQPALDAARVGALIDQLCALADIAEAASARRAGPGDEPDDGDHSSGGVISST